jgi:hypothetical protein
VKYLGVDAASTPVDDRPGVLSEAFNTRLRISGELRRRRGLARANVAKLSGAVHAINSFSLSAGEPYAVVASEGEIDGYEDPLSLWGDYQLVPVVGVAVFNGTTYALNVFRGSCEWMDSAVVFAQSGRYPTDLDMGTYVGEVALTPWSTSGQAFWTAPEPGTWYFRAYAVRNREMGPGGNMQSIESGIPSGAYCQHEIFDPNTATYLSGITIDTPGPYTTGNGGTTPRFNIYDAIQAGAITLPYSYTITTSFGGLPFPAVNLIFAVCGLVPVTGIIAGHGSLIGNGLGYSAGQVAHVNIAADGSDTSDYVMTMDV